MTGFQARLHAQLDRIELQQKQILHLLTSLGGFMATSSVTQQQALDELKAQVQANSDVETSALQLIQGLSDQLKTVNDTASLEAFKAQLAQSASALAAAVTANTATAPTPAPAPTTASAT